MLLVALWKESMVNSLESRLTFSLLFSAFTNVLISIQVFLLLSIMNS